MTPTSPRKRADAGDATDTESSPTAPDAAAPTTANTAPAATGSTPPAADAAPLTAGQKLLAAATPAVADDDPSMVVTYGAWWPAIARLPNGATVQNVRIYATSDGVIVYDAPGSVAFASGIDYASNPRPTGNPVTEGVRLVTADGELLLGQAVVGCSSCGSGGGLKTWEPEFAARIAAWPETVPA